LPDISGVDVIRHVSASAPETLLIVYTSLFVDGNDRHVLRDAGARIITKGNMSPIELADEVVRLVAKADSSARPARQVG
jgi:hypothetical protein